ncbi:MAG: hypothetical protein DCF19_23790 [Pseudanabaena frigida]|uniref:Peptidoglycan binding-like domain-containing protein n=1 Tax=Pseudanabaena frigida TaxID=945775 RepID=A0A2W4VSX1_9CYAN|nr:MAG: hypothetical protein DCF19_23790 [Pseudanabaena frigida]
MELAAYIYDAWAYEQANQEPQDLDLLNSDEIFSGRHQQNGLCWDLTISRWRSYLLSAIAFTSLSGFGLGLERPVEASQLLEPSVNVAPWCNNLYLCSTSYVLEVQTLLAKRGFDVGDLDGVYGRQTKQAVIDFQKTQKNLAVDGIPGDKTLALLRDSSAMLPIAPNKNTPVISDRPSSIVIVRDNNPQPVNIQAVERSEIGNLQILLKQRGFYQGEIDGRQGQSTTEAVMKAQQAYGLASDGFAGPLTVRALLAGGNNVPLNQPAFNQSPTSQDVLQAQQLLKERGFYDGELNGLYSFRTKASISNAQTAYGQKATGELSTELLTALKAQNIAQSNIQNVQSNPDTRSSPNNDLPRNNSQAPSSGQNLPIPPEKSSTS